MPASWKTHFFTLWTGQAVSLLGSALVQFGLVWWLTEATGSATVLATASLAALLPQVLLGPAAGALVDRWNRRVVMVVADSVIAGATLGLMLLFATGTAQPWHVGVSLVIRSLASAFHMPAMQAATALMVPAARLSRVAGINQTLQGLLSIVAPPLAALLVAALPLHGLLAIDAATAVAGIAPLFFVRVPEPRRAAATGARPTSVGQDFVAGLRYLRGEPGLLIVMGLAAVINFLVQPAMTLVPILVTQHFGGTASQLATLQTAFGMGLMLGGALLAVWGGTRRRMLVALAAAAGAGLSFLVIGLTPATAFGAALPAILGAGAMMATTNGQFYAVLQARVAPSLQGRVFTLLGSATTAMAPLGLAAAGPVTDWLGAPAWYIASGVVTMALAGLALFLPPVVGLDAPQAMAGAEQPS